MTQESATENLRIKLNGLLARDISDLGFEAKARHQRRIDALRNAIEFAGADDAEFHAELAHTD